MRGEVIGFDPSTNTGAIIGHDAKRYDFIRMDWRMSSVPRAGDEVDFAIEDNTSKQIFLVQAGQASAMTAGGAAAVGRSSGSLGWLWFSLTGRATRFDFWVRYFLLAVLLTAVAAAIGKGAGGVRGQLAAQGIVSLLLIWPGIAVQVKRLHDRNMTGFHILILIVLYIAAFALIFNDMGGVPNLRNLDPRDLVELMRYEAKFFAIPGIYALVLFIIMGFFRGTVGPNKYGPDPLQPPPAP